MRTAIFTTEKSLRKQKICNTLRAIVAEIVCVQIFVSFSSPARDISYLV